MTKKTTSYRAKNAITILNAQDLETSCGDHKNREESSNLEQRKQSKLLDPVGAGIVLGGEDTPIASATLADWRTKRQGPPYLKIGRLVRYREEDLASWLDSRLIKGVQ